MKNEQDMVREFHEAFVHPVATSPVAMSPERVDSRARWLAEEIDEFKHAQTLDEQADAMIDLLYFALGTMVEMGVDASPLFRIVHEANMSKLWPDGNPRLKSDGKVKKPPTWSDPSEALKRELARQMRFCPTTENERRFAKTP